MRTLLTVLGVLAASNTGSSNNVTDTRGGSKFIMASLCSVKF